MYLENIILNTFDCFFSISHTIQISLRLGTILPDSANLFAGFLIGTFSTSLVAFIGYTFMYLAHVATELQSCGDSSRCRNGRRWL